MRFRNPEALADPPLAWVRRPILDARGDCYAYRFCFDPRAGDQREFELDDLPSRLLPVYLPILTENLPQVPRTLPPPAILEVSSEAFQNPQMRELMLTLSQKGYRFATRHVCGNRWDALPAGPIITILPASCRNWPGIPAGAEVMAQGVDHDDHFEAARNAGCRYFEGNFYLSSKTLALAGVDQPDLLPLIARTFQPDLGLEAIAEIVHETPPLSFKMMGLVNSPLFPWVTRIRTISHGLALLGTGDARRCLQIAVLLRNDTHHLLVEAVIRGRLCQGIARLMGDTASGYFQLGVLSLVDCLTGLPREALIRSIPLPENLKRALAGRENTMHLVLQLTIAHTKACWQTRDRVAARLSLETSQLHLLYQGAVRFADLMLPA